MNNDTTAIAAITDHAEWVAAYNRQSFIASAAGPDAPLTPESRAAYMSLPALIDECKAAWDNIPAGARPVHYLLDGSRIASSANQPR